MRWLLGLLLVLPAWGQEPLQDELRRILVQAGQPQTMPIPPDQRIPVEDDPASLVPS